MINPCRVCGKPLKRMKSEAHSGSCANIWYKRKTEQVDRQYFAEQVQGGFAYDEASVMV